MQGEIAKFCSSAEIKENISNEVALIIDWILKCKSLTFFDFEKQLILKIFALAKLFVSLFLSMREEHYRDTHTRAEKNYMFQGPKSRVISTFFGKVRYWRTYLYNTTGSGGYYPLDIELGLPLDGFSMLLRSYAVRIGTKMSYAQSVLVLGMFLQWSPCQKSIEEMVLGLGRHTGHWFESAPPPKAYMGRFFKSYY